MNNFILFFFIFFKLNYGKVLSWGLGIGDWAQSPIPNPHLNLF